MNLFHKIIQRIKKELKLKRYNCYQCEDTGEIWGGFSGMEIYKCPCREEIEEKSLGLPWG